MIPPLRTITDPHALERIADDLGLRPKPGLPPHIPWQPARNLAQAQEVFFLTLPTQYPDVGLEYHRYQSGHIRAIAWGRDFLFSDDSAPGELPAFTLLRVACLAAEYCAYNPLTCPENGVELSQRRPHGETKKV